MYRYTGDSFDSAKLLNRVEPIRKGGNGENEENGENGENGGNGENGENREN